MGILRELSRLKATTYDIKESLKNVSHLYANTEYVHKIKVSIFLLYPSITLHGYSFGQGRQLATSIIFGQSGQKLQNSLH